MSLVCSFLQNKSLTFSLPVFHRQIDPFIFFILPPGLFFARWRVRGVQRNTQAELSGVASVSVSLSKHSPGIGFYLQLQPGGRLRPRPVEEGAPEPLLAVRRVSLWPAADEVPQVLETKQAGVIPERARKLKVFPSSLT